VAQSLAAGLRGDDAASVRAVHLALGKQDTVTVLSIVLSRIYVLRNQLIHGGQARGSHRLTGCQAVRVSAGIRTCRPDRERSRTAQRCGRWRSGRIWRDG
jgi:hypothetical protein